MGVGDGGRIVPQHKHVQILPPAPITMSKLTLNCLMHGYDPKSYFFGKNSFD
jgi:hypothetical protein